MFPYRAQVFNGYIASPDACQPINITGLALPQRRQQQQQQQQVALFPLPTQMGMPQPFSSTYGNEAINPFSYIPAQPPFAIPPQQQNFFPLSFPSSQFAPPPAVFPPPPPPQLQLQPQQQQQQQGSSAQRSHLVTPAITPPQNRQLTARPNAAAPETSMNPGMQIPAKTVVLPPRRKPGRPTNASKGLLTKRELRSRKTRKRSSALASGAGTPEPVVAPVQQEPPVFDRASSSRLGSASFSGVPAVVSGSSSSSSSSSSLPAVWPSLPVSSSSSSSFLPTQPQVDLYAGYAPAVGYRPATTESSKPSNYFGMSDSEIDAAVEAQMDVLMGGE